MKHTFRREPGKEVREIKKKKKRYESTVIMYIYVVAIAKMGIYGVIDKLM